MSRQDLYNALSSEDKIDEISDERIAQAKCDYDADKVIQEIQQKKIEQLSEGIQDLKQDREQRKILSYALFSFMCIYMCIALCAVYLCGFGCMHLSDKVLITLMTTTLADIIGIFSFVAKYLYHHKDK